MKKILFLTDMWSPLPTANAVCVKNIAKVLKKREWQVYVNAFESNPRQKNEILDGIHVEYVKPSLPRQLITRSYFIKNKKSKKVVRNLGILLNRILRFTFLPYYPITAPLFTYLWSRKVIKQVRDNDINLIVSVNAPLDSIATGYLVKRKCSNVKWIAYYIDSGSNYGKEQNFLAIKKRLQTKSIKWENRVLQYADKIVIMEGHSQFYKSVLNEFNLNHMKILNVPLLSTRMEQEEAILCKKPSLKKEIWTYMGTIRDDIYNPEKLFKWFLQYCTTHNAELHLYGFTNMEDYLSTHCDNTHIFYHGVVAHDQVDKILENSDIFVYFISERLDSVSGKFFEYLMYKKPIVYFGPKNDINWKQLNKYPLGIAIDQATGEQSRPFEGLYDRKNDVSSDMLRSIYYTSTPEAFADMIDDTEKE